MAEFNGKQIMLVGLKGDKGEKGDKGDKGDKGEVGGGSVVTANPSVAALNKLERITIDNSTYSIGKRYKNFITCRDYGLSFNSSVGESEPINVLVSTNFKKKRTKNKSLYAKHNLKYCNYLSTRSFSKQNLSIDAGGGIDIFYKDLLKIIFKLESDGKETRDYPDDMFVRHKIVVGNTIHQSPLVYRFLEQYDPDDNPVDAGKFYRYPSDSRCVIAYADNHCNSWTGYGAWSYCKFILKFVRGYEEVTTIPKHKYWKGNMARDYLEVIVARQPDVESNEIKFYFLVKPHRF